jgi:hypothetical protein
MLKRIFPRTHRFHCPDVHQLVAYVDQQLIGAERERVESHIAKCDSCLEQVGFLIQQSQVSAVSAPSSLVQRAKELRGSTRGKALFAWQWVSVAAASAVVAIGLLVWHETRPNTEEHSGVIATGSEPSGLAIPGKVNPEAETAVRSVHAADSQPLVLSPQPGTTVRDSDFVIRWNPMPKAAAYEVRIVSADGDLVWRIRVHTNSVSPPKQTLRPGLKYFVWVRALLADGKTQQSEAVGFIGG